MTFIEKDNGDVNKDTSTGFNLNPNGMAALKSLFPDIHFYLCELGLPRTRIIANNFLGNLLFDEELFSDLGNRGLADNFGLRIRWRDAYRVIRYLSKPIYGVAVVDYSEQKDKKLTVKLKHNTINQKEQIIKDVDLLIATDGRYSTIRDKVSKPNVYFPGVCNFRGLVKDTSNQMFNDMTLYYNDDPNIEDVRSTFPNLEYSVTGLPRIGIMKMPKTNYDGKDELYLYGNFPIDNSIPEEAKTGAGLRAIYTPKSKNISKECGYIIDTIAGHVSQLHWVRMQDIDPVFCNESKNILFLGDAAHATVPTLGQGATTAIEDAIFAAIQFRNFLNNKTSSLHKIVEIIAWARMERAKEISKLSLMATEHLKHGDTKSLLSREIAAWRNHDSEFRRLYRRAMLNYPCLRG